MAGPCFLISTSIVASGAKLKCHFLKKNYHECAERVRPRLGRKRGLTAKSLQWLRRRFRSSLRQHGSALSCAASCAGTEVPGYLRSNSKCGAPSTRAPRSLGITAFQEGKRQPTLRSSDEERIDRPIFDLVMRLHLEALGEDRMQHGGAQSSPGSSASNRVAEYLREAAFGFCQTLPPSFGMMEKQMTRSRSVMAGILLVAASAAHAAPRHVTVGSLDPNARQLFQESMDLG